MAAQEEKTKAAATQPQEEKTEAAAAQPQPEQHPEVGKAAPNCYEESSPMPMQQRPRTFPDGFAPMDPMDVNK